MFLVLIAAGLLATAVHTGHEGGWINALQGQALDLSWLVVPGTVTSSLLTGMLGLQPRPTDGELAAYLIYALPMLLFVLWPQRRAVRERKPTVTTERASAQSKASTKQVTQPRTERA